MYTMYTLLLRCPKLLFRVNTHKLSKDVDNSVILRCLFIEVRSHKKKRYVIHSSIEMTVIFLETLLNVRGIVFNKMTTKAKYRFKPL